MQQAHPQHHADRHPVVQQLIDKHGPILSGRMLSKAMGFTSLKAFNQARRRGNLGIKTFRIEGRRGLFAYTSDYLTWLDLRGTHE